MDLSKISKFQLIVLGLLIGAAFLGLGMFALYRGSSEVITPVTIWGTLPATSFNTLLANPAVKGNFELNNISVSYEEHTAQNIDSDLIRAMAYNVAPDVIILSQDQIISYQDRILPIPYNLLSQRAVRDTFVPEAELYLTSEGVSAMPFMIDPMVMYYNRDILTSANIALPPSIWTTIYDMTSKINKVDSANAISRTTIALGGYDNINHAKDIISLLLLQIGTPIVGWETSNSRYMAYLTSNPTSSQNPGDLALNFYTQFADPTRSIYSWNSALPSARDMFVAGKSALYLGYASEFGDLRQRNPNLNFDVAMVPQPANAETKMTYGNLYGMALLRTSPSQQAAFNAITVLSGDAVQQLWSGLTGLPPVTRSLLAQTPDNPYSTVFYTAALQSRGWLDPNRDLTNSLFSTMVRSIVSGAKKPMEAVQTAQAALQQYLTN